MSLRNRIELNYYSRKRRENTSRHVHRKALRQATFLSRKKRGNTTCPRRDITRVVRHRSTHSKGPFLPHSLLPYHSNPVSPEPPTPLHSIQSNPSTHSQKQLRPSHAVRRAAPTAADVLRPAPGPAVPAGAAAETKEGSGLFDGVFSDAMLLLCV